MGSWRFASAEDLSQATPPAVLLIGHEGVVTPRAVLVKTTCCAAARPGTSMAVPNWPWVPHWPFISVRTKASRRDDTSTYCPPAAC